MKKRILTTRLNPTSPSKNIRIKGFKFQTSLKLDDVVYSLSQGYVKTYGKSPLYLRMRASTLLALQKDSLLRAPRGIIDSKGLGSFEWQTPSGTMYVRVCSDTWRPFQGFLPLPEGVIAVYLNLKSFPIFMFDLRGRQGEVGHSFECFRQMVGLDPIVRLKKQRKGANWNF